MKKTPVVQTKEEAIRKTKKQIAVVAIIGVILIAADMIMTSGNEIAVENSYGQLYLIRPEAEGDNGYLTLKAEIKGENGIYEKKINIMLEPYNNEEPGQTAKRESDTDIEMTDEEYYDYHLNSMADAVNKDNSVKKVKLPAKLETGEAIFWQVEDDTNSNIIIILIMVVVVSGMLYKERFSSIRKIEESNRLSVNRQLPGFINRLVLLLNAGMVLSSAFEKAVEESYTDKTIDDYFYRNIRGIYSSMKKANGSMNKGLKEFARRSGVRELMRISNIIDDNISKGTELTEKLRGESEILWMVRKKRCEELGRLTETKLTLPLMLFLIVLIIITISPALLGL